MMRVFSIQRCPHFNPRSPCGERLSKTLVQKRSQSFQSTLPVWGATSRHAPRKLYPSISIHAPRVGSDRGRTPASKRLVVFQSTLPVWGATLIAALVSSGSRKFQSTLPVWGATLDKCIVLSIVLISIHAPRVGSDTAIRSPAKAVRHFNPRSPCGERLCIGVFFLE